MYKFWGKVAGAKFAQKSKPYSLIPGGTMVIACETPAVAQELMLKKTQLLVKLKPYAETLKIKINDLKFDTKKMGEYLILLPVGIVLNHICIRGFKFCVSAFYKIC